MRDHHRQVCGYGCLAGKRLGAKGDEWLWHVLTIALGAGSKARCKRLVSPFEFEEWKAFHDLWPLDDSAWDRRFALIASTSSHGAVEIQDAKDWLDRTPDPMSAFSAADQAMFKAAGIKPPRKG